MKTVRCFLSLFNTPFSGFLSHTFFCSLSCFLAEPWQFAGRAQAVADRAQAVCWPSQAVCWPSPGSLLAEPRQFAGRAPAVCWLVELFQRLIQRLVLVDVCAHGHLPYGCKNDGFFQFFQGCSHLKKLSTC